MLCLKVEFNIHFGDFGRWCKLQLIVMVLWCDVTKGIEHLERISTPKTHTLGTCAHLQNPNYVLNNTLINIRLQIQCH